MTGPEPIETRYTSATPAEVERAIERTAGRYVADFAGLYDRISAEVGQLYEAQIAAKDEALTARDATIAELRRRAEVAERERDELRSQASPQPPSATTTPTTAPAAQSLWARVRRAFGGEEGASIMPPVSDDLAASVYRFIADYGPVTATAVATALGLDARRVGNAMARLLDARRLAVAGVTRDDEPLYAIVAE